MAAPTYNVTLHHLAPGAKAAGLGYGDESMATATSAQLVELLHAFSEVAATISIYEPSSPEIRVKTDREVFIIRTRYRRLCFTGRESALRGEEHSIAYIMATISGVNEPLVVAPPTRPVERPGSAHPHGMRPGSRGTHHPIGQTSEWVKATLLLVVSLACVSVGVYLLMKPPRAGGPTFKYLPASESGAVLTKIAGEYRTGISPGDRRLIIAPDGTLRIAKFGPSQAIAEEIIRTARGAISDGQTGLATSDPYLMLVRDADSVMLYGMTFKRVVQ